LLIPVPVIAITRSSTRRVLTPSMQACMITACSATSMRRRGSSSDGKNAPVRILGIVTITAPLAVVTVLGRLPLRWVVQVSVRSCRPAPT
jgi:hypothetical protein